MLLNDNNFKIVYRFIRNTDGYNLCIDKYSTNDFEYFAQLVNIYSAQQNIENVDVHIDIEIKYDDDDNSYFKYIDKDCLKYDTAIWLHGITMNIKEFNKDKQLEYIDCVKNKQIHLSNKTYNIITNNDNSTLFVIRCLYQQYSLNEILELNNLLLNISSNNYLGIILEEDENINLDELDLKNTCIVTYPSSDINKIDCAYKDLFEKLKIVMNLSFNNIII